MKWLRILLVALLLAVIAAIGISCADLLRRPVVTPDPVGSDPTLIALTLTVGQPVTPTTILEPTPTATETASVAVVLDPSGSPQPSPSHIPPPLLPTSTATSGTSLSFTPTVTPAPDIPKAAIQIADPGPLSRIISPLQLTATLRTVPSGSYHIELWAEPLTPEDDPRLLLREVHNFIADPIPWIFIDQPLEFELSRVSELGELRILTYDRYGRQVAAASVELLLLQYGEDQLTPGSDTLEPLVLLDPTPNILIQGGVLNVAGLARLLDNTPLLIELIAANGTIAGVQQIFLTPDPAGRHIPFTAEVSYTVASPTWVRLVISQSGARIPGIRMLNSLEVLLSP